MGDERKPRVLVVDDEEPIRILVSDILEMEGFEVFSAPNGTMALELAWKKLADLAVVDIGLPDMSGWEVCQRMLADFRTKHVGIVVITAQPRPEALREMARLKLQHFVNKPFDPSYLAALVKKLCESNPKLKPVP